MYDIPSVWETQVWNPYIRVGKIMVLWIWIFMFSESRGEDKYSEPNSSTYSPNLICSSFFMNAISISPLFFMYFFLKGTTPQSVSFTEAKMFCIWQMLWEVRYFPAYLGYSWRWSYLFTCHRGLETVWNFSKGTGLSWVDIRLWCTKGPSIRPRCIGTLRVRTQY